MTYNIDRINSLHLDETTRNSTRTTTKHVESLSVEQKLQKLGKLNERDLEKEADRKMKGTQNYIMVLSRFTF